jgi:Family of unknown function (DUF5677)
MEAAEVDVHGFPLPPCYSDEEILALARQNQAQSIFFDWLKFAAGRAVIFAFMIETQASVRSVPHIQYAVTTGLLNRIGRLGRSVVQVAHDEENDIGEVAMIMQRCIFESCTTLTWLCMDHSADRFVQFLASSWQEDMKFKKHIEAQISSNNGEALPVETRLLQTISNREVATGLSEATLKAIKSKPNLRDMLSAIHDKVYINSSQNFKDREYFTSQTMGSHAVHGSWANLLANFLEEAGEFKFAPRATAIETDLSQFADIAKNILQACISFTLWRFQDSIENRQHVADLGVCLSEIHRQFLLIKEDEEQRRLEN